MINGEPPFLGDSQIDQLIEIIKIMGTPSKAEVIEMNPQYDLQEYSKFPIVKKTEWKNVFFIINLGPENKRPTIDRLGPQHDAILPKTTIFSLISLKTQIFRLATSLRHLQVASSQSKDYPIAI
jgi:hypothetical protein